MLDSVRWLLLGTALSALLTAGCAAAAPSQPAAPPAAAAPLTTAAVSTNTPMPSPSATPAPTATSTAASGPSVADLAARARQNTEYSFTLRVTAAGVSYSGKTYVKGMKIRQEASVGGQNVIFILDGEQKVAYVVMVDQKTAMKVDFSQIASQVENPVEQVSALPPDVRYVGTETVDGKTAAVYEVVSGQTKSKMWIWTERGLPLKIQADSPSGPATVEFLDYQFGPQPDSLFELPPGVQVTEIPGGLPTMVPVPPKP